MEGDRWALSQNGFFRKRPLLHGFAAEHMARFAFASEFVKGVTVLDCACGSGVGSRRFSDSHAKKSSRSIWVMPR
jgi:hypothetical protein